MKEKIRIEEFLHMLIVICIAVFFFIVIIWINIFLH